MNKHTKSVCEQIGDVIMKKLLLAVIVGVALIQSAYAGSARITTISIGNACYETTAPGANPVIAKLSDCDAKDAYIQAKVMYSTSMPAYRRDDGATVIGYTVYMTTDQDNVMRQIKVSDVSLP